ncbi:hypothetical protein BTN99_06455 [Vibrio campbellii]|nr:hypothetical protein BTN99_06455 [Vibrio campbellii]
MDRQAKFHRDLFEQTTWQTVNIEQLVADEILTHFYAKANPIALLRNQPNHKHHPAYLFNLLALQSPIICYSFRRHYRYLAGSFTIEKLRDAIAKNELPSDKEIPVFVLNKKPNSELRKQIIQFDLTNNLIDKCFISDTKKISFLLRNWFQKDEGKRSIFQSQEWLSLYPNLNTVEKTAAYLSISKKDF